MIKGVQLCAQAIFNRCVRVINNFLSNDYIDTSADFCCCFYAFAILISNQNVLFLYYYFYINFIQLAVRLIKICLLI